MNDKEAYEYYKDPEHLRPAGPWVAALLRPGVRNLCYTPAELGPQNQTVNVRSQRYWRHNPDAEEL